MGQRPDAAAGSAGWHGPVGAIRRSLRGNAYWNSAPSSRHGSGRPRAGTASGIPWIKQPITSQTARQTAADAAFDQGEETVYARPDGLEDFEPGSAGVPGMAAPAEGGRRVRTFSLRAYLTVMALAVMVPMGALGAFAIIRSCKEYQYSYQERLRATARLLGIALDSEIEMHKTAIMALANSPLLDEPSSPTSTTMPSRSARAWAPG